MICWYISITDSHTIVNGILKKGTRFHKWRSFEVPSFEQIPCGWAEAIRRYNGSGADAEAYRDEILTRITGAERIYAV